MHLKPECKSCYLENYFSISKYKLIYVIYCYVYDVKHYLNVKASLWLKNNPKNSLKIVIQVKEVANLK